MTHSYSVFISIICFARQFLVDLALQPTLLFEDLPVRRHGFLDLRSQAAYARGNHDQQDPQSHSKKPDDPHQAQSTCARKKEQQNAQKDREGRAKDHGPCTCDRAPQLDGSYELNNTYDHYIGGNKID